ncbi:hypothetical protein [Streptomyces sp. NPDC004589]|uniref:hypothetical protein n=1 Tax=Streptomyces sp. NPDC004589 TaxID=3154553 RepID=UPI0033A06C0A
MQEQEAGREFAAGRLGELFVAERRVEVRTDTVDVGPHAGVVLPGGEALFVEGEDDVLAVDLGRGEPAQAAAGVGGYEGAARRVAAEAGQRPHLAEAVDEDDAVDVRVEGCPGLLLLAVEAESAAPDREFLGVFRELSGVEGVPVVAAQVDFSGLYRL